MATPHPLQSQVNCTIKIMSRSVIIAFKRSGLTLVIVAMLAMWIYAFFFSSRESINKIGDEAWAAHAAKVCLDAKEQLLGLANYDLIQDESDLAERAQIVRQANVILRQMIQDIESRPPSDEKGQAIVPLWLSDYATYLDDREGYVRLLEDGTNSPFAETQVDGIPLSEKIATFATANRMPACSPPRDLSV